MKEAPIQRLPLAIILAASIMLAALLFWEPLRDAATTWKQRQIQRKEEARHARNRAHFDDLNSRPPAMLPERAADRARYGRDSFSIAFRGTDGFAVDTVLGTATQDRIVPDSTFACVLTPAQIDTLYEMALAGRFFEMHQPDPMLPAWYSAHEHGGELAVRWGGEQRVFRWMALSTEFAWSDDLKRLNTLVGVLHRMVKTHPAFVAMPRLRGVYID